MSSTPTKQSKLRYIGYSLRYIIIFFAIVTIVSVPIDIARDIYKNNVPTDVGSEAGIPNFTLRGVSFYRSWNPRLIEIKGDITNLSSIDVEYITMSCTVFMNESRYGTRRTVDVVQRINAGESVSFSGAFFGRTSSSAVKARCKIIRAHPIQ